MKSGSPKQNSLSGIQSSHRKISGTSGDDPLWTLSDEDLTTDRNNDQ